MAINKGFISPMTDFGKGAEKLEMTTKYIKLAYLILLSFCLISPSVYAESEIITIDGARIRGNQELPTVLYLVPWQAPKVYKLDTPETTLASQRPIKPLERESFKRLISYHQLFSNSAKAPSNQVSEHDSVIKKTK